MCCGCEEVQGGVGRLKEVERVIGRRDLGKNGLGRYKRVMGGESRILTQGDRQLSNQHCTLLPLQ